MSLVTVPQVNPNDEVTALSVNQGPNAIAAVVNGNLDDTNISTVSGSKITSGTLPSSAAAPSANIETFRSDSKINYVINGLTWSTLTGLNASMVTGDIYSSNGQRVTVAAIASNTFTASRDTFVSVSPTGVITYQPVTNGATQPVKAAGYLWVAKVVTNVSAITSILDIRRTAYLPDVRFQAYLTSTWNPGAPGNNTLLAAGGTIDYDTSGSLSSTGMYTVKVEGIYTFSANARDSSANSSALYLSKNNALYLGGSSKTGSVTQRLSSTWSGVYLMPGDVVSANVDYGAGSIYNGDRVNNSFSGVLTCAL